VNFDLDSLTECIQKPKEAVDAVAFDAAPYQGGHLRLVNSEQFGGFCLGELSLSDEVTDALDEFGLGEG